MYSINNIMLDILYVIEYKATIIILFTLLPPMRLFHVYMSSFTSGHIVGITVTVAEIRPSPFGTLERMHVHGRERSTQYCSFGIRLWMN